MRINAILFVVCFTLGLSLMVFSGYVPQSASARGNDGGDEPTVASESDNGGSRVYRYRARPVVRRPRTYTEYVPAVETYDDEIESGEYLGTELEPALAAGNIDNVHADAGEDYDPEDAAVAADSLRELDRAFAEPAPGPGGSDYAPEVGEYDPERIKEGLGEDDLEDYPLADAGADRVIWVGWGDFQLDASNSFGEHLSYSWAQVAGNPQLTLVTPGRAGTLVTGLPLTEELGWYDMVYEFEVTIADDRGRTGVDSVEILARAAPELEVVPGADRRFELRDGYQIAHFESWITNLDTYQSVFEIIAPTDLTFTRVSGSDTDYAIGGGKLENQFVYTVTVYGNDGIDTSWVELLIDSADKIPGIVQLGVSWVER